MASTTHPEGGAGPLDQLRARLVTELRERLIEQAVALPLGNQPALVRAAELCRSEDVTAHQVAAEAALDDGFAATLLRVANSAAIGGTSRIEDLPAAITRLGFTFVECLAVTAPCLRLLAAPSDGLEGARRELHRHSVRTAIVARTLACGAIHPDRALAAGLVHNLGLSVLSLHARSGFRKLLEAATLGEQLSEAETRYFGFTHAELGALLAAEWSFPDSMVDVIREHDAVTPPTAIAALVQTSDLLVREAGYGIEPPLAPQDEAARRAGLELDEARERAATLLAPAADAPPRAAGLVELLESLA